jgi:hypothetical protein
MNGPSPKGAGGSNWFFVAFFAALGGLFAYHAWSQASDYLALSSRGQRTEAMVVGHEEARGRRSTTWYPVLRFVTAEGRQVEAASGVAAAPSDLPRGRRVQVVYDPAEPTNLRPAAAFEAGPGVTPWILGGLALLMFLLGGAFLLPRRAREAG